DLATGCRDHGASAAAGAGAFGVAGAVAELDGARAGGWSGVAAGAAADGARLLPAGTAGTGDGAGPVAGAHRRTSAGVHLLGAGDRLHSVQPAFCGATGAGWFPLRRYGTTGERGSAGGFALARADAGAT